MKIGIIDSTTDANSYWDASTMQVHRPVVMIDDRMPNTYQYKYYDRQVYDVWLLGLMVGFGVGNVIPQDTWIGLPISKTIAAEGAGHITDHKLTDKAVRYLKIVEQMNGSE